MAPQIDATYGRIEALLGGEFSERFQQMLDVLLATLKPYAIGKPGLPTPHERSRREAPRRRAVREQFTE